MATKAIAGWLKSNQKKFEDKESFLVAAAKAYPASSRKTILNRISDLVQCGDLPSRLIGKRGETQLPKDEVGKRLKKSGGKKVPKKFRMAVDATLVKDEWDDEAKIDEGLANLGTQVIKDNDSRSELGIAQDRWKLVSTSEKYTASKIDLKGKTYRGVFWGHEDVIRSLQKKVDMV